MIVTVCSDKGSPGVTTVATALGVVWPGERVVVECDPSGADLPFRLRAADGAWLSPEPWLGSLAAAARMGLPGPGLESFSQQALLGVRVIPGGLSAERFTPIRALWPQVARGLAAAAGAVIVDAGQVHAGHGATPVISASAAVLVLTRPDTAGLFHVRDRVTSLTQAVGVGPGDAPRVMVAVVGGGRRRREVAAVERMLAAAGLPCPVVGAIPWDAAGARDLWSGPLTRRLAGSSLMRAVRALGEELLRLRPDMAPAGSAGGSVAAEGAPQPEPAGEVVAS